MIPKTWNFKKWKRPRTIDIQTPPTHPSSTAASSHQPDHQTLKTHTRVSTTVYDRIATDWWWWELASWLVSFSCVTAILALLLHYNGRTQPSHVARGITLNAFIAIFSAIAKAAMILPVSEAIGQLKWIWVQKERKLFDVLAFDNASRGPLGSLMLLTTKYKELVSLGAAITVLALTFEPFFQQSVSYPAREISNKSGTINIATSYSPINDVNYAVATEVRWEGVSNGNAIRIAALEVANAISARNEPVRSAPFVCPTGRCTWSAYSSLGVCHRCQDVSRLLKPVSQGEKFAIPGNAAAIINPNGYHLNHTMMTGFWGLWDTNAMSLSTLIVGDRANLLGDGVYWNSTCFQKAPQVLLDFYVGFVPGGDHGLLRNVTPVLSECIFQWCVRTFEASYQNGRLDERVLSTYLPPETEVVSTTPASMLLSSAPNDPFVMVAGDKMFGVEANTTRRLRNSLNANMPVYLTNDSLDTTGQFPGRWNFVQNTPYNVNWVLGSMADAITNHMRSSANNDTEQFFGEAWNTETFVQTQWLWVLLPVMLLLGSLVLISATIIRSRKEQVPSWKSSILAALLHGLTEDARGHFISDATQSEVEALSRKVTIKMSPGRRLVPLESPPVMTSRDVLRPR